MASRWGDEKFVEYLRQNLYHPRSSAHGDAMCLFILEDIINHCAAFKRAITEKKLVYERNYTIGADPLTSWNIDLVVGPRQPGQTVLDSTSPTSVPTGVPSQIWVAIDAKAIMTEHGKARRNRMRDLESMHSQLHREYPTAILGAVVALNLAEKFKSPLRREITLHRNIDRLIQETVLMFDKLPQARTPEEKGLDALSIVVLRHTNVPGEASELVRSPPAPVPGTRLHYQTFIKDICTAFEARFSK